MNKTSLRQNIRKTLLLVSLLLFPITIWYFSPYLIIAGAYNHLINGSFIVFVTMLVLSMFFGRLFCSFLCPMGGLQECIAQIRDKKTNSKSHYVSKYIIFTVWISAVITTFILGKGDFKIDFFFDTDHGISISNIYCFIIYYGILILFFIPSFIFGKRFGCHYFCWMSPFMVIGEKLGRLLHLPQVRIKSVPSKCVGCSICSKKCPMSIDVKELVKDGAILSAECIQCGVCVDCCPKDVLHYSFLNKKEIEEEEKCQLKTKMPS